MVGWAGADGCGGDDGETVDLARNHAGQPCAVDRLIKERLDAEEARKAREEAEFEAELEAERKALESGES